MTDKKTASRAVEPVQVTIIGTSDGRVLETGTIAKTAGAHLPDLITNVVSPLFAILIRFVNDFLTALVGILTGAMASNIIPAEDFLHLLVKCASLAVAGAAVAFLKNLVTVFGKLEQSHPIASGSI